MQGLEVMTPEWYFPFFSRVLFIFHVACLFLYFFLLLSAFIFSPFLCTSLRFFNITHRQLNQCSISINVLPLQLRSFSQRQFSIMAGHLDLKAMFQIFLLGRKTGDWNHSPENTVLTLLNDSHPGLEKVFSTVHFWDATGVSMLIILWIDISHHRVTGIPLELVICLISFLNQWHMCAYK